MASKGELLRSYLEARGLQLREFATGWQKVSCINKVAHPRGDRNPSASVNLTSGYYKCFACDMSGDVFDLYMQETGVDFRTAQTTLGGVAHREEETWL
jgi:hypothetical protein